MEINFDNVELLHVVFEHH